MTAQSWTVRDVLEWTGKYFERQQIDTPRLDAEVLLGHTLGCDRTRLYMDFERPLDPDERTRYRALVERRAKGEPAAYLTGLKEFYARDFVVDARVLIPRPETEGLIDRLLDHLSRDQNARFLDLCSGSGCIGITVACERPGVEVVAVELSEAAQAVAVQNAERHGVRDRYLQLGGNLFSEVEGRFDAIGTNPPYVPEATLPELQREVRDHEPAIALTPGPAGTEVAFPVIEQAANHLAPGGLLVMEHGEEQGERMREHAEQTGLYVKVETAPDAAGLDRLLLAWVG